MSDTVEIMVLIAIVFVWVICGVFAYGITLGYFEHKYPSCGPFSFSFNRAAAIIMAIGGPIGLFVAYVESCGAEHGYSFKITWRASND